jgi:membrane fusion protein (multidrug efflux system)
MYLNLRKTIFVALCLTLAACGGKKDDKSSEKKVEVISSSGVPVETMVVGASNFEDMIQIQGVVESSSDVTVSSQSAGTLEYVAAVGQFVQKGQVVAQVNASLVQAGIDQARAAIQAADAQLNLANDTFKRQQPLYRDSIISAIEFEGVRTRLAAAQAQKAQTEAALRLSERQLVNTKVYAPFSGTIERRLVEPGSQAAPGTPIVQIVNTGNVKVTGGVSERYAANIGIGTPVTIKIPAMGDGSIIGSVRFVGANVNPASRTFPIEVDVANSDGILKPQMSAQMYIAKETLGNVVVIPETSIIRDEEGTSVFVARMQGAKRTAMRVKISVGPTQEGKTVVLTGLNNGDEVIINGQNNISDGDQVEVVKQ